MKIIELKESVTASNDRDADALREELTSKGVLLINLMSSPGSGKTTLLKKTVSDMSDQRIAVLEADIDSAVDAERMEAAGAKSIQVHTDGMCHMDAGMTKRGLDEMGLEDVDLAFLENVGNLICPAEFDTGAQKNVMILSVPEGDDKPLKYPLMFQKSDVLVITKMDTKGFFTFSIEKCVERVKHLNPDIQIFPVSAKTGEGMQEWEEWLRKAVNEIKQEESRI
ncbi:MAG: hydrogenase nickel incorporation protein HypB [Stecheria intestinalis]|jgi:hydrogenase nickel incorporation protein HypB|uniref:hydrogenase nickel incorporation protein HypB n=1 Tax=Stecheria intestinalis TaxID=2606630 RepID=UPI0023F59223|nr:hydrogenase nickel incorporation protein HypB [Stecheria intestinalis]MCI2154633.1 hydrogenase nickel incorporation protein HypB [Solobacterium sp.]MDD5881659.1 hydrogenase nickel incorporation protein HypB [Stecheria intestinalis]MDD6367532.1 hydrogenase nickel incorporation protein HypB [Stecheria intestinalis]